MTTLCAKGYTTDGVPVFLWGYGNYKYEVEVKKLNFSQSEVFDASFNEAVNKFEDRAINGVEYYFENCLRECPEWSFVYC